MIEGTQTMARDPQPLKLWTVHPLDARCPGPKCSLQPTASITIIPSEVGMDVVLSGPQLSHDRQPSLVTCEHHHVAGGQAIHLDG